jgi:hypothetical protein
MAGASNGLVADTCLRGTPFGADLSDSDTQVPDMLLIIMSLSLPSLASTQIAQITIAYVMLAFGASTHTTARGTARMSVDDDQDDGQSHRDLM